MVSTTKAKKANPTWAALAALPMSQDIGRMLRTPGKFFAGPCVVQSAGAWTRVGPTWLLPGLGWLTYGPGVARWGTKRGIAQLASDADSAPQFHAFGWTLSPAPNLVLPMLSPALTSEPFKVLAAAIEAAASMEEPAA